MALEEFNYYKERRVRISLDKLEKSKVSIAKKYGLSQSILLAFYIPVWPSWWEETSLLASSEALPSLNPLVPHNILSVV